MDPRIMDENSQSMITYTMYGLHGTKNKMKESRLFWIFGYRGVVV